MKIQTQQRIYTSHLAKKFSPQDNATEMKHLDFLKRQEKSKLLLYHQKMQKAYTSAQTLRVKIPSILTKNSSITHIGKNFKPLVPQRHLFSKKKTQTETT